MPTFETVLASAAIKEASGPARNFLVKYGIKKYDAFIVNYTNAFGTYYTSSVQKCGNVKNIIYRNQLASTREKYVSVSFKSKLKDRKEDRSDANIVKDLIDKKHIIISGSGGAGKTMFTKWAVLNISDSLQNHQMIPIYIELRELSSSGNFRYLHEHIYDHITDFDNKTTMNQFIEGLKSGLFIILLDAADELDKKIRPEIMKKIQEFSNKFENCGLLVTTREFEEVESLAGFDIYNTKPLSREQAIEIIHKLDYDAEVKAGLLKDIDGENNDIYNVFMENPLLVTIMLLTYDQSKEIPTKRSSVYKRAFEALYERHDGAKGIYKRELHAGLSIEDFERVFSAFCYGTYINSVYDFPATELPRLFKEALRIAEIDADPAAVARDSCESTCLLVKEGHDYVFAHRSFQEYFAACYIKSYRGDDVRSIFDSALFRIGLGENTLEFLYEIDLNSLEMNYVIPHLKEIISKINKYDLSQDSRRYAAIKFFFKLVRFSAKGGFRGFDFNNEEYCNFLINIGEIYPESDLVSVLLDHKNDTLKINLNFGSEAIASKYVRRVMHSEDYTIYEFKFPPRMPLWITGSTALPKAETLVRELKALLLRLETHYEKQDGEITSRFAGFGRG